MILSPETPLWAAVIQFDGYDHVIVYLAETLVCVLHVFPWGVPSDMRIVCVCQAESLHVSKALCPSGHSEEHPNPCH